MISKALEEAINDQIAKEEHSNRIYLAMASWCQNNKFKGASNFLYKQADEERFHQLKFVHYLNDREGSAKLQALETPQSSWNSLLDVFKGVLEHERYISDSINKLYELSLQEKDHATSNFLQWYLSEQVEEETVAGEILDMLELAGDSKIGLFQADKELEAMAAAKVVETIPL